VNPTSPFSLATLAIVVLSLFGLPIGHAMIAGSVLYLWMAGLDMGTAAEQLLNGMYTSYVLLAIPLFILAAEFMNSGSIMDRLLRFCNALVGRWRGGLAHVNVVQSIIFAWHVGVRARGCRGQRQDHADPDDEGRQVHAGLRRRADGGVVGDRPDHSAVDTARHLRAGLRHVDRLPVSRRRRSGPAARLRADGADRVHGPEPQLSVEPPVPVRELPRVAWQAFPALMMPVILLGLMYSGVTTPTEAAAAAAFYALLVSALVYRSIGWRDFHQSLMNSARMTISIGMLIAGAIVFNYVITVENIPKTISAVLKAYELSPFTFLLLANLLLLVLGCFLEGTTILLIIVPVMLPTAQALGVDPVHFGVVAVVNIMIGLITPPYGLLLFMMVKIADVPLKDIVRDILPFLGVMIAALALITFVPELVLFLPRLFGYQG
jgi:TRAP-type C4-dicarboxylate transport system permease large subunit